MNQSRLAKDVMVTRLITLTPGTSVFDGIARLLRSRVSGAPVVQERRCYVGVFSENCCLRVLSTTAKLAQDRGTLKAVTAEDIMTRSLVTLSPQMDAFEAIGYLLRHKISGAPVVDRKRQLVGIFSEKTSMSVLLESAYEQMPTSNVEEFMESDENSSISSDLGLLEIVQLFLDKPCRRLQVLRDGRLIGQISRRDALRAAHTAALRAPQHEQFLRKWQQEEELGAVQETASEASAESNGEASVEPLQPFVDTDARTITPETDLLSIAHIFRETSSRRLPVVESGELVGQVSRRDLLAATNDLMKIAPKREKPLLYLSSLVDREESPID